jgi:hypothetical protein
MYAIFSAVQRQHRKSDVVTSFGRTAGSAVYYQVPHCRFLINLSPRNVSINPANPKYKNNNVIVIPIS